MEDSDSVAIARVRAGDGDAYRALVERHSRGVFRLAFRMTGNEQDAEDIVQETFLRAYRQLHRYESRASFGTWLYRIAANCSLDLARSRSRHPQTELVEKAAGDPGPDDDVGDRHAEDEVDRGRRARELQAVGDRRDGEEG